MNINIVELYTSCNYFENIESNNTDSCDLKMYYRILHSEVKNAKIFFECRLYYNI